MVSADTVPLGEHGPLALPLAQGNPVLQNLGLVRIDIETLPEGVFGRRIIVCGLKNAGGLLQRGQLVRDGFPVDCAETSGRV